MSNQWPNKEVPAAKRDFTTTQDQTVVKEDIKPSTRHELKQLDAERKRAKPEPRLVPKGVKVAKSKGELDREARAAKIRERLERARGRCQNEFTQKM